MQPRRQRDGALRRVAPEADGAARLLRDDLLHSGDGPPQSTEHLGTFAERNSARQRRSLDAVDERALELVGQPVGQLLQRRLAEGYARRSPFPGVMDDLIP